MLYCLCPHCGEDYRPSRRDQRYCSNACRQAAYRLRKAGGAPSPLPCAGASQAAEGATVLAERRFLPDGSPSGWGVLPDGRWVRIPYDMRHFVEVAIGD